MLKTFLTFSLVSQGDFLQQYFEWPPEQLPLNHMASLLSRFSIMPPWQQGVTLVSATRVTVDVHAAFLQHCCSSVAPLTGLPGWISDWKSCDAALWQLPQTCLSLILWICMNSTASDSIFFFFILFSFIKNLCFVSLNFRSWNFPAKCCSKNLGRSQRSSAADPLPNFCHTVQHVQCPEALLSLPKIRMKKWHAPLNNARLSSRQTQESTQK